MAIRQLIRENQPNMEHLPEVEQGFKTIFDICIWSASEKVLIAGIKLGIFNVLSEPVSAEAVARAIDAHPQNTGLFLDGLTAIDLIKKEK
jgi:hypothetical protein